MGPTLTHVGGPTLLVELGGWRILSDPTFDPPGRRYAFGWGTSSRKVTGPALAAADLGPLDVVLLTHDHHADNLDDEGRGLLAAAPGVREAAVVGVPVEGVMRVRAVIITDSIQSPDTSLKAELQEWCKSRLQRFQYPHVIDFVDELPKTATGKIQRFRLREADCAGDD